VLVSVPVISSDAAGAEGCLAVDYTDRLRHLAINEGLPKTVSAEPESTPESWIRNAAARTARSVDHGRCTVPSHGAQADAAVNAGATAAEIVDVLVGVVPIVCLPCVAAAAPKLAMALGYDTEAGSEHQSSG
jgi:4-carboxymuconolactone decarboxylase